MFSLQAVEHGIHELCYIMNTDFKLLSLQKNLSSKNQPPV